MTKPVPDNLKADALKHMRENGWTPSKVVKWLKEEHKIKVTYAAVYAWMNPKPKKGGFTPRTEKTVIGPAQFEDGCMASVPDYQPPDRNAFICGLYRTPCAGTAASKRKCPQWAIVWALSQLR